MPGTSGVQHFPAALAPSGWQAGALMRNVAMTNKMKSVGEALQGFLETAVPSPLSAEERERLRLYNPTLAAQIDALDWKDVPSFIVAIIEEWRRSGSPSSKACHPLAAPEERKRPSPVSLEELAREQAREVACEVVRTASPKPIPAPSPLRASQPQHPCQLLRRSALRFGVAIQPVLHVFRHFFR